MIKQTDYKDVFDLSIMINAHLSRIYWKRIILYLYTIKIYKHEQSRYLKYTLKLLQRKILIQVKTVNYGLESIQFLGPEILKSLPNDFKKKESFDSFKTAIKKQKPESCPCCLCKTYIQNIGYL